MIRFLLWLAAFGAFLWFAFSVPLGSRTLAGHLRAIAGTTEAKDLAKGTREEASKAVGKVRGVLGRDPGREQQLRPGEKPADPATAPPQDQLRDEDRAALDRLVRERTAGHAAPGAPAPAPSAPAPAPSAPAR